MNDLATPNFTAMFAQAYETGRTQARSRGVQNALAMAPTNPTGAQNELLRFGAIDESNALAKQAETSRLQGLRTEAAPFIEKGDYSGAQGVYAAGGDFDTAAAIGKMTDSQRAAAKEKAELIAGIGYRLKDVKGPDGREDIPARRAALANAAPFLQAQGFTPEQIEQVDLSDNGINALVGAAMSFKDQMEMDKPVEVSAGGRLVTRDGREIYRAPEKPVYQTVKDGDGTEHLIVIGGEEGGGQRQRGGMGAIPGGTRAPSGGVYDSIGNLAARNGASAAEGAYLRRLAQVESGGRADAQNGSSTSYFQFHPETFRGVLPGGDIHSLADQTLAAQKLQAQDRAALQAAGIEPTDANTYIMHQQGAGGGKALLTAPPEVGAVAAVAPAYRSPSVAVAAIAGNIGLPYKTARQRASANAVAQELTAGEFTEFWRRRWAGQQASIYDVIGDGDGPQQQGAQGGGAQGPGVRELFTGRPKPVRSKRALTPEEIRTRGLKPGTVAEMDENGDVKVLQTPNESDTKAGGYINRVLNANDRLNELAERGLFKPTPQLLISEKNGVTRITASNPNDRAFVQASKEWLAPILRKDTGAAVTDGELVTYADIYVPMPEDPPAVLWQKAQARDAAMRSLIGEGGQVYQGMFGKPPPRYRVMAPTAGRPQQPRPAAGAKPAARPSLDQIFGGQ